MSMWDEPSGTVGAAAWAAEMARLREFKPRPLHKRYGQNPTPEQVKSHRDEERAWNKVYRKASAEQKRAMRERRW